MSAEQPASTQEDAACDLPQQPSAPWWRRLIATPPELGFLPHVWLVFLGFFILPMRWMPVSGAPLWICIGALIVFLPSYYSAFRREGRAMLVPIGIIALLGTVLAPINHGSSVFFHYASFLTGQATSARRALLLVAFFCLVIVLNTKLFDLPGYYYGPTILVSLGLVGISINERQRKLADTALRRSQEEVERLARLAERERIARDMHDVVGHTLSVITLKAQLAGKLIDTDPARSARELQDIARASRMALSSVRETISGYRKVGLAEQVNDARRSLASANVTVTTDIGDLDLPPRHESMIALLLREAVTNVIRHANASRCHLALHRTADGLELVVHDDGMGFDGDEGQGLTGMRERLAVLEGELNFADGPGTRLVARIPLRRTP